MIDASFYGAIGSTQPTGTASVQPNPENTAPVRTEPRPGQSGIFTSPAFWLVVIVGSALGLVHLSVRWS
jgi:hypothetical protein